MVARLMAHLAVWAFIAYVCALMLVGCGDALQEPPGGSAAMATVVDRECKPSTCHPTGVVPSKEQR